jgi:hypothetical protein
MLSAAELDKLERRLSKERLGYWTVLAHGDREGGLLLHRRNTLIAAVLYADLQVLEIALRNAFDHELQKKYPPDWLNHPKFRSRKGVVIAKDFARKIHDAHHTRHDKILVCLSFGFWVRLLDGKKMRSVLSHAFKPGTDMDYVFHGLKELLALRNSVAHHEPILDGTRKGKILKESLQVLHDILDAICPTTAKWLDVHSWVRPLVIAELTSCAKLESYEVPIFVP